MHCLATTTVRHPDIGRDGHLRIRSLRLRAGPSSERVRLTFAERAMSWNHWEAALWAFHSSQSFDEGALMAANLGDDADTTAAIYGQIAGAYYGAEAIPPKWRSKLAHRELITEMADSLHR